MSDAIDRATVVREVALALGRYHQDEAAYLVPQARAVADHLYEQGLIAPAPLREVQAEAWDEGWEACHAFMGRGVFPPQTNPHRETT